ncbi:NADH-quinone oxidoreductase subunit C [Rufibacter glacialis]|uniref:NADH-quinone oxidoreductase subunit C n=1 Tax=Rufibacter glacialis TaxID=1259555 RepID=A0A5M8QLW2_9BACT|nr:NADH-quinone oxidoreductase subunit C [Rufibacter glacialis]KAA6437135.1 NADH-quinone oxidoreductase subunit C [Rufibacter glacialis]GGK61831.1 NADH-quinone oxidoreductase subunit C [Rufibacter glacialis]
MAELTNELLVQALQEKFGDQLFDIHEPYGLVTVTTTRENIIPMLQTLYDDASLQFQFLTTMCGIHYPDNKGQELGVIYLLHSLVNNVRLRIKIFFSEDDAVVPTATNLYATANWMERETFDFYGIRFEGHPNLIRILNVEEMEAFPMRKEFPLEDQTREDKINTFFGR